MKKFNIGDLVSPIRNFKTREWSIIKGEVYEVEANSKPPMSHCYRLKDCTPDVHPENLRKVGIINNKLNRRLYPNWKEYKAHLVPPKTAGKLSEESNEL